MYITPPWSDKVGNSYSGGLHITVKLLGVTALILLFVLQAAPKPPTASKASLAEEMPDATDTDYQGFATQMIEQAKQITLAVETSNPALARQAAAQLGQSCQDCHDNFR